MRNQFTEYKTLLQTFPLEEQIDEINDVIRSLANKKHKANMVDRRYGRIKELKQMRDNIKRIISNKSCNMSKNHIHYK